MKLLRLFVLPAMLCLIHSLMSHGQSQKVDSIFKSISGLHDTTKVDSLMTLARMNLGPDKILAIQLLERAEELALANGDSLEWAGCLAMHGFCIPDSQIMHSLNLYEKCIPVLVQNEHPYQIQALANAANILIQLGDYEQAISYQQQGLDYAKLIGDRRLEVALMTNLGYTYDRMHDYQKALEIQRIALREAQAENDSFHIAMISMRIANAIDGGGSGDLDSSLYYHRKSFRIYKQLGDEYRQAQVLGNISTVLRYKGELDLALDTLILAAEMNKKSGEIYPYALNVINMGKILLDQSNYDAAIDSLLSGLQLAEEVSDVNFKLDALDYLHQAYAAKGDHEKANHYLLRYANLNDTVFDEEKAKQVANLQERYETAEKEREIASLSADKAKAELEASHQRGWAIGLAGGAGVLLLTAGFAFYYVRQRQQAILKEKEIAFREKLITAQVNSQEEERKRIAKELHDGIAQSLAALKMQFQSHVRNSKSLDAIERERFNTSIKTLDDAGQEVRSISHQMMPRALMELGLVTAIDDLLAKSLSFTEIDFSYEHEGVEDGMLTQRLEVALYRICQELINNIVKHSGATEVQVQLHTAANHVVLMVEDNGKGFELGKTGDGIGMMNINSRASAINGKISFEKGFEHGTVAMVRIPTNLT